jgi:hypothetical protein
MTDGNVTPIRPDVPVAIQASPEPRAPKRKPRPSGASVKAKAVERQIEKARNVIFQAQSIAAVAAAAAVSEMPANRHCTKDTLSFVFELLDKAAALLDPATMGRVLAIADEKEAYG